MRTFICKQITHYVNIKLSEEQKLIDQEVEKNKILEAIFESGKAAVEKEC
jgi:hypothetical protein